MEQIKDLLATVGHGLMVFCFIIMMPLTSFNLCLNVLSNSNFYYKNKFWLLMNFLNEVKSDNMVLLLWFRAMPVVEIQV